MNRTLKKYLKIIAKIILAFVAIILLYIIAAFILSSITVGGDENNKREVAIYILTNGVHTDIVVPTLSEQIDWSQEIKFENTVSKNSGFRYLAIGWGDRGFYLETPRWEDLKFSVAFKATFGLGKSAMHTTYYSRMVESERCRKIMISKEQYARLIEYISGSLARDSSGEVMPIITSAQYGKNDAFYNAKGHFSLLNSCNTWANRALKVSGQKACLWTPFKDGIFWKYE